MTAEAWLFSTGTGVPLVARAEHDQTGIALGEVFVAEPEAFHRAGGEVLNDHVGFGEESPGQVQAALGLQVKRDAALAVVEVVEDASTFGAWNVVLERRVMRPEAVEPLVRLDADDVGAVVAKMFAHHRAGRVSAKLDHLGAGERSGHITPAARSVTRSSGFRHSSSTKTSVLCSPVAGAERRMSGRCPSKSANEPGT